MNRGCMKIMNKNTHFLYVKDKAVADKLVALGLIKLPSSGSYYVFKNDTKLLSHFSNIRGIIYTNTLFF